MRECTLDAAVVLCPSGCCAVKTCQACGRGIDGRGGAGVTLGHVVTTPKSYRELRVQHSTAQHGTAQTYKSTYLF